MVCTINSRFCFTMASSLLHYAETKAKKPILQCLALAGFYLLGEAGGKLLPQTLQLPPQIFATSSTFYIVVEVGPTLVSRMPQLLHHMGRGTPSSPCVLPYLRLNTDSFSPKFQILDRTLFGSLVPLAWHVCL